MKSQYNIDNDHVTRKLETRTGGHYKSYWLYQEHKRKHRECAEQKENVLENMKGHA